MIPSLRKPDPNCPWPVLPPGIHDTDFAEIESLFAVNPTRKALFSGLLRAAKALQQAGCKTLYLDGSFTTDKPNPGDFDACWDPSGVDPNSLPPVFLDFANKRQAQKALYGGEFFLTIQSAKPGTRFLEFFQTERYTGATKGILRIDLTTESFSGLQV